MSPDRPGRWRSRLRAYGAAVMLNAAIVTGVPSVTMLEPVPIVRPFARARPGFDPREIVGDGLVLTVPRVEVGAGLAQDCRPHQLN